MRTTVRSPDACRARAVGVVRAGAVLLATMVGAALDAGAAEYCVSCTKPDAAYACQIEGASAQQGDDPMAKLACVSELAKQGGHATCAVDRASAAPCAGARHVLGQAGFSAPDGQKAGTPAAPPPGKDTQLGGAPPAAAPSAPTGKPAPAAASAKTAPPAGPALRDDSGKPLAAPRATESMRTYQPEDGAARMPNAKPGSGADGAPRTVQEMIEKGGAGDAAKSAGTAIEGAGSAVGNAAKKTWKCLTSLFGDC